MEMGSPQYPTQGQVERLRKAAQLPDSEKQKLNGGILTLTLSGQSLALIVLK